MKNIQQNGGKSQRKQLTKLTRKIKKVSPAETLNLISEAIPMIQNNYINEWLLRFKSTFQFLQSRGVK